MKLQPIQIIKANNTHRQQLVRDVMEVNNRTKLTCVYNNNTIDFPNPTEKLIRMLNVLKIKFQETKK